VRLVSITQELGDDPMSNMIRQIMALFDEYQSKENAKHTLRAMKENARQGFWNGSLPPIGYRIVEATEQRGHRIKKTLKIDPIQAETVAQRVEVDAKEVRIMGSKSVLLRTLVAASSAKTAGFGVPSFVPKWRARRDSNPRPPDSKSVAL
jgi:DNA invertase Pin-like site-specific DNA recombinase